MKRQIENPTAFCEDLQALLQKHSIATVSSDNMDSEEFKNICEKWQLGNPFLGVLLGKKDPTIRGYRYMNNNIPISIAVLMRQLDLTLERLKEN